MLCNDGAEKVKLRKRSAIDLNESWDLNKSFLDNSKSHLCPEFKGAFQ